KETLSIGTDGTLGAILFLLADFRGDAAGDTSGDAPSS
ncbi:hypothetical protein L195_g064695, partial [Trifolium pratense]